ncbi:hypothetical protein IB276_32800 [Ensifer sp. ENS04]|uniref:AAA family ATPase n=1 Tax=Ensifer sp. ENS04 TaxID=2769281 RepID=UPI00177EAF8B|nr:hypothetical protein [Ensifer sp. ENS04]MBD9544225.1 hypothetical protein [Ensifer sp. ENS04]
MLKQLEYSVTFPTTGRTLSEAVLFQGGFGAIVGPNESGKSMIIEMTRYCLFGSAALRGKSEDYKNLKASLSWTMKGSEYLVERTMTKAKLTRDGEVIAVGTAPVNAKIPAEIGFGLAVFDMSCVANQNQLLKLGEMKPGERQRAVDSVIGVSILDDLAKYAGDEALALRRAADDLSSNLHEPVEPAEPAGYQNSSVLEAQKAKLDLVRSEADQLRGWLANDKPKPVKPEDKIGIGSAVLQEYLDAQTERRVQRQTLEAELARIPAAANITEEELQADEEAERQNNLYLARRKFLTYHQRPDYTQKQLDELLTSWESHKNFLRLRHLQKQAQDLISKGEHICPSCSHNWPIASDALAPINDEIGKLVDILPLQEAAPAVSETEIERQQRLIDGWDEAEWQKHANSPTTQVNVQWTIQDRIRHRHAIEGKARRAELQAQIDQLKPTDKEPDYASMLRERQQYEAQLGAWSDKVAEYEAWEQERGQKQIQLAMLDVDLQGYAELSQLLDQARIYEHNMLAYSCAFSRWSEGMLKVSEYRVDADDWSKVKDALKILRLKIKQHLVPSLNRVASSLITHMTGGQRQTVTVDEEFNITVDGQAIDTLSGSGAAVANLALRIGLGQVLTNNVFSLFVGDEIDASMDKNRAEKTSQVLGTLKGRISQLLLVSHKFPAADYYIAVGENIDQDFHTH